MARDLITRAVAEQIAAQQSGGRFDPEAIRAAVAAEQRGDHLDADELRRLADAEVAQARARVAAAPSDRGGSTRIHDAIVAQYRATELRRLAEQRGAQ